MLRQGGGVGVGDNGSQAFNMQVTRTNYPVALGKTICPLSYNVNPIYFED